VSIDVENERLISLFIAVSKARRRLHALTVGANNINGPSKDQCGTVKMPEGLL